MAHLSTAARMIAHAKRGLPIEENRPMHMAINTRRWTRSDLARLPDDNNKYEVVRGELFVTPAPRSRHQEIVVVLVRRLMPYVTANRLGDIHQPRSVMVFDGSEVEPDLMVRPFVPAPPPEWEDAPIPFLVVEVSSDATRRRDQLQKRALYLDAGVSEYWIMDGDQRSIRRVRLDQDDEVVTDTLRWHPTGVRAPLDLDVAGLFRDALG
jgi:Uma2 family endonuclease